MAYPRTIKPAATYEVTLAQPITLGGRLISPDASRITMTGETLKGIDKASIADAREVGAHDEPEAAPAAAPPAGGVV